MTLSVVLNILFQVPCLVVYLYSLERDEVLCGPLDRPRGALLLFFLFFFYDPSSFPDTTLIRVHVFSYTCSLRPLGVRGWGGGGGGGR